MARPRNPLTTKLSVETLKHDEATRKNIPTAEYQSVMQKDEQSPMRIAYERRNGDLDPQPPLYIQEKVHPKVLIDSLLSDIRRGNLDVGYLEFME